MPLVPQRNVLQAEELDSPFWLGNWVSSRADGFKEMLHASGFTERKISRKCSYALDLVDQIRSARWALDTLPGNKVVTRDPKSPVAQRLEKFVEEEVDGMTRADKERLEKQQGKIIGNRGGGDGEGEEEGEDYDGEEEDEDDDDDEEEEEEEEEDYDDEEDNDYEEE